MKKVIIVITVLLLALACFIGIKRIMFSGEADKVTETLADIDDEKVNKVLSGFYEKIEDGIHGFVGRLFDGNTDSLEDWITGLVGRMSGEEANTSVDGRRDLGTEAVPTWCRRISDILHNALVKQEAASTGELPTRYDYRETGRQSVVKDQTDINTCWAMAATTAVETGVRPQNQLVLSADHLSLHNPYEYDSEYGGNYYMSMAYLLGWNGPVNEADDPYGDGYSPDGLAPVLHVQEVRILDVYDYGGRLINGNEEERSAALQGIEEMRQDMKSLVFNYGAVETSLYIDLNLQYGYSDYYNNSTNAYCYTGEECANHEVVIIGWDDGYSASNFSVPVEGDGAFICQNSWGEFFGENGVFYVSYYDTQIVNVCLCYSGVEGTDNYDNIYQYDEHGWTGQLGYSEDTAYFANIYTATGNQIPEAVGLYTVGPDSDYVIYFVSDYVDVSSLTAENPVAYGHIDDMGYYTISINSDCELREGENFAVIVKITTPGCSSPVAVEYGDNAGSWTMDINGCGYISSDGVNWNSAEGDNNSDLCLKVYTTDL